MRNLLRAIESDIDDQADGPPARFTPVDIMDDVSISPAPQGTTRWHRLSAIFRVMVRP